MRKNILLISAVALCAGLAFGQMAPVNANLRQGSTYPEAQTPKAVEGGPVALSGASCTQACRDDYELCLDLCDIGPYPGCASDCRDFLYACYLACLGG